MTITLEERSRVQMDNEQSGTFSPNMKLPIHRWFRYSAGFSAEWVRNIMAENKAKIVLDPFVGSGTVCIEADRRGIISYGVESHPFVYRLAQAKASWAANIVDFKQYIEEIKSYVKRDNSIAANTDISTLLFKLLFYLFMA